MGFFSFVTSSCEKSEAKYSCQKKSQKSGISIALAQNGIALNQRPKFGAMQRSLKEQFIKNSFIGEFSSTIPTK
jgi:hypothetical protein